MCVFQKCGIESLVDELCQKLKDFESDTVESTHEVPKSRRESDEFSDPAARYYAAFPALGTHRHHPDRTDVNQQQTNTFIGDEGYSTNSDHETCRTDDLDLEYEDLPVDIRGLLASPVTPTTPVRRRELPAQQNRPYIRCGTNITSSIWSQDVEDIVQQTVSVSRWSEGGDRRIVSLMQLNHGGESCFAEVLPGVLPKHNHVPSVRLPLEVPGTEEDLLTSARTHFRPIKHDESFGNPVYADGTTFQIRGNLEQVNYKRTESGGYYLQREGCSSPDRYLEWKPTTPVLSDAFVPRFRLSQNEKCCQTDVISNLSDVPRLESIIGEETPPPKRRVLSECFEEDLYFPGDCEQLLHEQWRTGTCCTECNGGEIWGAACVSCAPPISTRACDLRRLRDELSREGDQLLSDLQRIVMLPGAEILPAPTSQAPQTDHRKRRYSGAPACAALRPIWPPAAIQLHSLLRPVTL